MTDRAEKDSLSAANINRRGLLKCMAWAGTGVLWSVSGGLPRSLGLIGDAVAADPQASGFTFLQISDSHVPGTLRATAPFLLPDPRLCTAPRWPRAAAELAVV